MSITIQNVILLLITVFISQVIAKKTTVAPYNTTHIDSYPTPSKYYIISTILIIIIILILVYFCCSDTSRHIMIALLHWFIFMLIKIIMFVPAILILLYCYIYKAFVFIGNKLKNKQKIEIELHTSVVINNTDTTTNTTTDTTTNTTTDTFTDMPTDMITETIGFILYCYSYSGLIYPFSRNMNR